MPAKKLFFMERFLKEKSRGISANQAIQFKPPFGNIKVGKEQVSRKPLNIAERALMIPIFFNNISIL